MFTVVWEAIVVVCVALGVCAVPAQFGSGPTRYGNIVPPFLISRSQPEYTERAQAAGLEGQAVLRVRIDQEGFPQDIEFVEFTTSGIRVADPLGLDVKAVETVKRWRFHPASKDGEPTSSLGSVYVNFRLGPVRKTNFNPPVQFDTRSTDPSK